MIEKCITKETKPLIINVDNLIEYNKNNFDEFEVIAKRISDETGVPKNYVFHAPYYFFIDRWHKINGEWYFFKSDESDYHFIAELLGEIISEYFNLDTVHYQIGKLCIKDKYERYGVISKNFCDKNYVYKTAFNYKFEAKRDLSILEDIRKICPSNESYLLLLSDLKKFFIRDFYVSQGDRTGNNFMFKVGNDSIRLAPLYDYECSFGSYESFRYRNQIAEINLSCEETKNILLSDDEFQKLLNMIMEADMNRFTEEVEDRHHIIIDDRMKKFFNRHDNEMKCLLKERKIIK